MTTDAVTGSDPDYPHIERKFVVTGIDYDDYQYKIRRLKTKLEKRIEELIDLVEKVNGYIEKIDDSLIRQIITLRHIEGLTWEQVAARIGGNNTPDSVRMMHDRFLKGT
jgi:hypothetical protein